MCICTRIMHVYFQELCSKKRSEKTVVYDAFCGGLADASRGGPVVDDGCAREFLICSWYVSSAPFYQTSSAATSPEPTLPHLEHRHGH